MTRRPPGAGGPPASEMNLKGRGRGRLGRPVRASKWLAAGGRGGGLPGPRARPIGEPSRYGLRH